MTPEVELPKVCLPLEIQESLPLDYLFRQDALFQPDDLSRQEPRQGYLLAQIRQGDSVTNKSLSLREILRRCICSIKVRHPSPMPFLIADLLANPVLFLGTNNKKKILELDKELAPRGFQLRVPADYPDTYDVIEDGTTFMANARIKASAQAKHRGMWAIGEDSGLCVPALGGEPGIYSARFSGESATDASNNALLLERMKDIPVAKREAYYVSTIALSDPEGQIHIETSGECWGRILLQGRGEAGFGYDPLFEVAEYHQTFAELGIGVKRAISHRARSLRAFLRKLDAMTWNAQA